ncbi:hypothetical protein [Marininema halotolerans]|uniref:Uncharacterized protein n=1 Tax=Marininema halotolerans TaxID=1155944 RepID=A0A1I6UT48_9BACL|nr:hypothetical protein [Marininema halotolerans]SFT04570.1 hypothetical protein SAMN05444972_12012 [Marininema halotolerans]
MTDKVIGVGFIAISAFLYATHYITAAIYASNLKSWDQDIFTNFLIYTSGNFNYLIFSSAIIGVVYLIKGEFFRK